MGVPRYKRGAYPLLGWDVVILRNEWIGTTFFFIGDIVYL